MTARPGGSPLLTFSVLLGGLVALLGGAELVARFVVPEGAAAPVPGMPFLQTDPVLLWRTRPHYDAMPSQGFHLRTNAQGMRAPELSPKAGRTRVLSLGESSTWGYFVEEPQTYAAQLQARLTADGLSVEVDNAGQPAWSSWQSLRWLQTEGAAWEPDIVLAYHASNDTMLRGASDPHAVIRTALTDRQLLDARAPYARLGGVLTASRLAALVWHHLLEPRLVPALPATAPHDVVRVPPEDRADALDGLATWCTAHHARLVLIEPVYSAKKERDRFVVGWAQAHGVDVVDLPTLKAAQGVPDFFQPDETHPTPEGHAWIAAQLEAALRP